MILPTKHITEQRSLIGQGGLVLALLEEREHTVSSLWEDFCNTAREEYEVTFDWFILAVDLLYAIGAIEMDRGVLRSRGVSDK
jgi:hypothetical protein